MSRKKDRDWAESEARMASWVYLCSGCGAECRQAVWAALGLAEPEECCPRCGAWVRFTVKDLTERQAAA